MAEGSAPREPERWAGLHAARALRRLALFDGAGRAQMDRLLAGSTTISVPSEAVLCRQGERGDHAFVILAGQANVTVDGRRIARLGPGTCFGELSVIDGSPRSATVTACGDLELLVLEGAAVRNALVEIPAFAMRLLAVLCSRLRLANRSAGSPTDRLAGDRIAPGGSRLRPVPSPPWGATVVRGAERSGSTADRGAHPSGATVLPVADAPRGIDRSGDSAP